MYLPLHRYPLTCTILSFESEDSDPTCIENQSSQMYIVEKMEKVFSSF